MDTPDPMPTRPRRGRVFRFLKIAILVFVAAFLLLWFGISPNVPRKPVHLVRDDNGQMAPANPRDPSGGHSLEMQAGSIAANNEFISTSSSSSGRSGFACGRMLILNRSDHLLAARVGQLLLDHFQSLGHVRQIDYYPPGFSPEEGQLAPDVTITLDMNALKESGLLIKHTTEVDFRVSAGNEPPNCSNGYNDRLTPPLARFDWNGTLHHTSTTTGVSSSGAKYKLVAENIAKQIAGSLTQEMKSRLEKEGPLKEIPQAFYPPYRNCPSLPLDELGKPEIIFSWHGLMNRNETLWSLAIDRPAGEILDKIEQRLKETGWKNSSESKEADRNYLLMLNDAAVLLVYVPSSAMVLHPMSSPDSPPKAAGLYVHYTDRMTENELRAAIDDSLAKNVSPDVLIAFESRLTDDQCRRLLKALESQPIRTPQTALKLANLHRRLKQDDRARRELLHAVALLRTLSDSSNLANSIKELAKELGDEKLADAPIEPKLLKELGFIELKAGVELPPQEIGFEEPVHFYALKSDGSLNTISLRISGNTLKRNNSFYQLSFVESKDHSRSYGTCGISYSFSIDDRARANFSIAPLGAGRFRLNTHWSGM